MGTKTVTPDITRQYVESKGGKHFEMWWDETNNTIHLLQVGSTGAVEMYDFEQTRATKVQKK